MIRRLQVRLVVSLMIAVGILIFGWLRLRARYQVADKSEELLIPLPSDTPAIPITIPSDDKSRSQESVRSETVPAELSAPSIDINSQKPQQEEGQEEDATQALQEDTETIPDAYCVRCRQKRRIENVQRITTKNGRAALSGVCAECNTRLFRFISSKG